jgi:hypothetical protein
MRPPGDIGGKEQRLLRHARREGLLIMAVWAAALLWSCLGSYITAFRRPADPMTLILGMPAWVFWFVALPWAICLVFTAWFCFAFMADDDLGQDPEEGQPHE